MWPFDSVPTLDDFRSRIPSWVPGASPSPPEPSPSMNPPQGGRRKTYRRKAKKSKRRRTGRKAIGSLVRLFRM